MGAGQPDRRDAFGILNLDSLGDVITRPHALGPAVPLVRAVFTSLADRNGFLIRNRRLFEAARGLGAVIFDKTGAPATGEFSVSEALAFDGPAG